jgi:quercetin dioxygenase-like cupin family protein
MVTDLNALAERLLAEAADHPRGRAAHLVVSGDRLRVTAMALRAGEALGEHDAPPAATLHALSGEVVLHADGEATTLRAGEIAPIPQARHDLQATTDAVVVLTACLEV